MALSQNQFAISPYQGMVDQRYSYNTSSVQIDNSEPSSGLLPGTPVKVVDSSGGLPKVLACTASADPCWGFINFDAKTVGFVAGNMAEISQRGNVIYLTSTGAISRGANVALDVTGGGVSAVTGTGGGRIIGYAYDKFSGAGSLGRVHVTTPGGLLDTATGA